MCKLRRMILHQLMYTCPEQTDIVVIFTTL